MHRASSVVSASSPTSKGATSHEPRNVLIVDDDEDLRLALGDLIEDVGPNRCVGAASLDDVVSLGPRALGCGVAILDVNLGAGRPSGLDVLEWLRRHGFEGRAVFLTGHASGSRQVRMALAIGGSPVLAKPLEIDALVKLLEAPT
jgi:DNA-binding NtrC family response regulator